MKILLVNKFHWRKGGAETYYFEVAEALREMGHEVAFFSMHHPSNLPCDEERYFVTQREYNERTSLLKTAEDGLNLIYSREARDKFDELCRDFEPDVVHLNNVHRQITFSILDAPSLGDTPVVWTAHDYIRVCPAYLMMDGSGEVCSRCLDGKFRHCIENRCVKGSLAKSALAAGEASFLRRKGIYGRVDLTIAPSKFLADRLVAGGADSSQIMVMRNFVDVSSMPDEVPVPDCEHPYLLYFGRLSAEKGIITLVDAFVRVAGELSNWRLVVAGDGPERETIEAKVSSMPVDVASRIELVGYQTGEPLRKLVRRATLTASPSECLENGPYAVLVALQVGTPVVATRMGGIPELVREGKTGFLADARDTDSLAAAILRGAAVAADASSYAVLQERCRTFIRESCSKVDYMKHLVDAYEGLIEEKGANRG